MSKIVQFPAKPVDYMELRNRALDSFWVFCNEVMGMKLEEKPHREMCDYLEDPLQPNKMMLVPRDCLKTTIGSTLYPLWMVLRAYFRDNNPCYRVLIDSSTVRLSKFVIKNIASWLQNHDVLKETFGNLYTKRGDNAEGLSLTFRMNAASGVKEPNFVASGIGAEKTGLHFELISMDDIVTKDNVRTVAMREKTWEHYRMMQAILESDDSGQQTRQVIIGTRYGDDDLYGRIMLQDKERMAESKAPVYAPMVRAAIDEEGHLFYPKKLTKDVLASRRSVMAGLFWAQYMNDPNKEGAPLKADQLKWHSISDFPSESQGGLRWIRLSADPAYKEEERTHGDYSALVVAGWDKWNALWILDVVMRKDLTPGKFIEQVIFLAKKWKIESAIIENSHEEAMDILFRREMQERQFSVPIFWVKPSRTRGKEMRWLDIQSYAERYAIKIATEIPPDTKVEICDEWERAPFSRYDDFLDALQLQTLYLPIDLSSSEVIGAGSSERGIEELTEIRAHSDTPYFGTLAQRFPVVADVMRGQGKPELAIWEKNTFAEAMESTFGD